ncbi:MAG: BatA domain-containing protein, partial [Acidobacteria bacterium]|nr:BatA domain-containing protein [Acidobacteriota bacterium]
MGFLTPWFFAGLGLLGLPLYLHLLKRHRSETQQFSSLMFFEKSTQADLKHRRLDYLVLLAARLMLLTLIVLAFVQPFVWRAGAADARAERLVVVDTSASMGVAGRMQKARDEAASLVRQGARLAAFDSRLRVLPAADVSRLEATASRNSFGELARALRSYQQSLKHPLEVHLVSDLQRSAMPAGFSDLRLNADLRLVLHALGEKPAATDYVRRGGA